MMAIQTHLAVISLTLLGCLVASSLAEDNQTEIYQSLRKLDDCIVHASYSNLHASNYLPTTMEAHRDICKLQSDGLKCIKENSKRSHSMIKRAMTAYVGSRQRHHKKYCTNPNSELSKKFVNDMKCIRGTNFDVARKIESDFALKVVEIAKRDIRDPGLELKHVCCSFYDLKQGLIEKARKECPKSMDMYEEMLGTVYPSEMSFICDEDEKLAKTCSKLEPVKISGTFKPMPGNSPSVLVLFIVSTLGEPNPPSILT